MHLKIVVRSWKGNCKSPLWSLFFGAQQKVKISKQNPDADQEKEKERHRI